MGESMHQAPAKGQSEREGSQRKNPERARGEVPVAVNQARASGVCGVAVAEKSGLQACCPKVVSMKAPLAERRWQHKDKQLKARGKKWAAESERASAQTKQPAQTEGGLLEGRPLYAGRRSWCSKRSSSARRSFSLRRLLLILLMACSTVL